MIQTRFGIVFLLGTLLLLSGNTYAENQPKTQFKHFVDALKSNKLQEANELLNTILHNA